MITESSVVEYDILVSLHSLLGFDTVLFNAVAPIADNIDDFWKLQYEFFWW